MEGENGAGRPTKYKEEYNEQAYKLSLLGLTDVQMASVFDVCEATFHNWKKDFPKFLESIQKGKEIADSEIAASLYHRAKGYKHTEDKIFLHEGNPVIVPTEKHYPPDTAAAFIWLKNRQPKIWRDKSEVEQTNINQYVLVDGIEDEDEV